MTLRASARGWPTGATRMKSSSKSGSTSTSGSVVGKLTMPTSRAPLASWGTMLFDGFTYLEQSVWPVLVAAGMLTLATLGFTLFGEALRDAIDPKLRR